MLKHIRWLCLSVVLLILASMPVSSAFLTFVQVVRDDKDGVDGLSQPLSVAISPDDAHLYVAGPGDDAVAVFGRDPLTGKLSFIQAETSDYGYTSAVVVSPDGKNVYATGLLGDRLVVLGRDAGTGQLTFLEAQEDEEDDGHGHTVDGLYAPWGVTVSPDGEHVYATGAGDDAVAVFSRDPSSGTLTFVRAYKDGIDGVDGLNSAQLVALDHSGQNVYVTGKGDNTVAVFSRDAESGELTFVETQEDGVDGVEGINGAKGLALSPDGQHVYVTGPGHTGLDRGKLAVFSRDANTGRLTFVEFHADGQGGVNGLKGAKGVTVSADGTHVYAVGYEDKALAVFSRDANTGRLTFVEFHKDGRDGVDGLGFATSVVTSADSRHVYAVAEDDSAVAVFSAPSTVGPLDPSAKTATPLILTSGQRVTYTVAIRRAGATLAAPVTLTDTLPAELDYVPGTLAAMSGTVDDSAAPTLRWSGTLSDTAVVTVTYVAQALGSAGISSVVVNTATIDAGPLGTITRTAVVVVNARRIYLPLALR